MDILEEMNLVGKNLKSKFLRQIVEKLKNFVYFKKIFFLINL